MDKKVVAAGVTGAGVGALQTPLIREFVDKKYPTTNIPSLKGFGYPSALIGIVGGTLGLTVGAVGMSKGKDGRQRLSDGYIEPAIDYGIAALLTGIFSGLYPAVTEADCVAKGGYFYDGVCHKEPASTLSMQNPPRVQTATSYTYKAPMIASPDTNVLKQLSAEVQRLSAETQRLGQENAALRTQGSETLQVVPGPVTGLQNRYGFMAGIETNQPLRATEQLRKKYDFMG